MISLAMALQYLQRIFPGIIGVFKKGRHMPHNSTALVDGGRVARAGSKLRRRDVPIGGVFKINGKTYMATGVRTAPPSAVGARSVTVKSGFGSQEATLGTLRPGAGTRKDSNGDLIIGYQSMVLEGTTNGDGAAVSKNGDATVLYLGLARIDWDR